MTVPSRTIASHESKYSVLSGGLPHCDDRPRPPQRRRARLRRLSPAGRDLRPSAALRNQAHSCPTRMVDGALLACRDLAARDAVVHHNDAGTLLTKVAAESWAAHTPVVARGWDKA